MKIPIYKVLANAIQADIRNGVYPVGGLLPPELELCKVHEVSRHTMREALRILHDQGIVQRTRGRGTTIVARETVPVFTHALGGINEIHHLAEVAPLQVRHYQVRPLSTAERERVGIDDLDPWLVCEATRNSNDLAIAYFEIYINGRFADIADSIGELRGAVKDAIAERFGVIEEKIEQTVTAELMSKAVARILGGNPGSSALRALRRYIDAKGEVILISDSVYAGSRFAYTMTYSRNGERGVNENRLEPSLK